MCQLPAKGSSAISAQPTKFVLMFPNGKVDPELFGSEEEAAAAGEEAFDTFSVFQLLPVATYRVVSALKRTPDLEAA